MGPGTGQAAGLSDPELRLGGEQALERNCKEGFELRLLVELEGQWYQAMDKAGGAEPCWEVGGATAGSGRSHAR